MGGNAFADTLPVTPEDFINLKPTLLLELKMLGVERVELIGSTGKSAVMGDIDLAVEHPQGRDFLAIQFTKLYGSECVKRMGSRQLTVRYLSVASGKCHQLDLIVGPAGCADWLAWSHHSPGPGSHVKGVVRNLLLNTIARELGETKGNERVRLLVDWDVGIFQATQIEDDGTGTWRTIHKKFVSSDPNVLVNTLFGKGYSAKDVVSLEDVTRVLKATSPRAPEILKGFINEIKQLAMSRPQLLGDVDATVRYVEQLYFLSLTSHVT